jgi:hypothetical protein
MTAYKARRLPNLAESPDLAASDSFRLRYIKGKMPDYNCKSWEDLLSKGMLMGVFKPGIKRGQSVI